jgi:hypothetical protein
MTMNWIFRLLVTWSFLPSNGPRISDWRAGESVKRYLTFIPLVYTDVMQCENDGERSADCGNIALRLPLGYSKMCDEFE